MSKRDFKTQRRRAMRRIVKNTDHHMYGNRRMYSMHYGEGAGHNDYRYAIRDAKLQMKDSICTAVN